MADKMTTLQELLDELIRRIDADYVQKIEKVGRWSQKGLGLDEQGQAVIRRVKSIKELAEQYKTKRQGS